MIELKALRFILIAILLGTSLVIISCDKDDDSAIISNSDILGKWESTTFQVSECASVGDNIEMRLCGFSDSDDVDCAVIEFRADGIVLEDGEPSEDGDRYTIDQDMLTFTDSQDNETITMRFEISENTLTFYLKEFNDPGCLLSTNLVRVK